MAQCAFWFIMRHVIQIFGHKKYNQEHPLICLQSGAVCIRIRQVETYFSGKDFLQSAGHTVLHNKMNIAFGYLSQVFRFHGKTSWKFNNFLRKLLSMNLDDTLDFHENFDRWLKKDSSKSTKIVGKVWHSAAIAGNAGTMHTDKSLSF